LNGSVQQTLFALYGGNGEREKEWRA